MTRLDRMPMDAIRGNSLCTLARMVLREAMAFSSDMGGADLKYTLTSLRRVVKKSWSAG